jgi:hypothetical protein
MLTDSLSHRQRFTSRGELRPPVAGSLGTARAWALFAARRVRRQATHSRSPCLLTASTAPMKPRTIATAEVVDNPFGVCRHHTVRTRAHLSRRAADCKTFHASRRDREDSHPRVAAHKAIAGARAVASHRAAGRFAAADRPSVACARRAATGCLDGVDDAAASSDGARPATARSMARTVRCAWLRDAPCAAAMGRRTEEAGTAGGRHANTTEDTDDTRRAPRSR